MFQRKIIYSYSILILVDSFPLSEFPFQNVLATTSLACQRSETFTACQMQEYGPWLTQYGQKFKVGGYCGRSCQQIARRDKPFRPGSGGIADEYIIVMYQPDFTTKTQQIMAI
jgi:hypothetical protein